MTSYIALLTYNNLEKTPMLKSNYLKLLQTININEIRVCELVNLAQVGRANQHIYIDFRRYKFKCITPPDSNYSNYSNYERCY